MTPPDEIAVRFDVYGCTTLGLPDVAERLGAHVPLPLTRRSGAQRGEYYRWSGDDGADLLVQANVPDEDGELMEPVAPVHAPLVYATALPGEVRAALARVDGLLLLSTDVVEVPRSPNPPAGLPRRPDARDRQGGTTGDATRNGREPLHVVR